MQTMSFIYRTMILIGGTMSIVIGNMGPSYVTMRIIGGWILNKVNGTMRIVGGTMSSIYGTVSIVGGTISNGLDAMEPYM